MGRRGGAALPTATRGGVPMVNISMIVLVTVVVVASCTGSNYGCAGLLPRCHDEERRALLQMKKYALVNNSSVLGDWPGVAGGEDCCQWRGITCNNHTGRVIRIDLPLEGISPNLASMLVQFKELEHLASLEWSTIRGTLPNGLCNMRTVTVIDFFYSSIKGNIPSCLGNLHDLERLQLSDNKITGTIPEGLCNLRNLKELHLRRNLLEGPIPSCLGNLHNLERLHLGRNRISGAIPDGLCNLRHLKELDLYANLLEGPIPQCLCSMRSLTQLALSGTQRRTMARTKATQVHSNGPKSIKDEKKKRKKCINGPRPMGLVYKKREQQLVFFQKKNQPKHVLAICVRHGWAAARVTRAGGNQRRRPRRTWAHPEERRREAASRWGEKAHADDAIGAFVPWFTRWEEREEEREKQDGGGREIKMRKR